MMNNFMLVGRLTSDLEVEETESGRKYSYITIAVNRSWKNENGEYGTDFIECVLWDGIAENTAEYCKKGDIVGVKGRIETGNKLIAEKITFLSSSNKEKVNDK